MFHIIHSTVYVCWKMTESLYVCWEVTESLYSSVIIPLLKFSQIGNEWKKISIVSSIKVMNLHICCV